jgi:hypothetical protein
LANGTHHTVVPIFNMLLFEVEQVNQPVFFCSRWFPNPRCVVRSLSKKYFDINLFCMQLNGKANLLITTNLDMSEVFNVCICYFDPIRCMSRWHSSATNCTSPDVISGRYSDWSSLASSFMFVLTLGPHIFLIHCSKSMRSFGQPFFDPCHWDASIESWWQCSSGERRTHAQVIMNVYCMKRR